MSQSVPWIQLIFQLPAKRWRQINVALMRATGNCSAEIHMYLRTFIIRSFGQTGTNKISFSMWPMAANVFGQPGQYLYPAAISFL